VAPAVIVADRSQEDDDGPGLRVVHLPEDGVDVNRCLDQIYVFTASTDGRDEHQLVARAEGDFARHVLVIDGEGEGLGQSTQTRVGGQEGLPYLARGGTIRNG
jgi:hypothetical protein